MIDITAPLDDYRYGFQGQEMDDEITNQSGTSYDFGARMYNPRVGKFLSLDPIKQPHESPYSFAANSVIAFVDFEGKDNIVYLVMIPSPKGKLEIKYDAQVVADIANERFKQLGVKTEVRVFSGSEFDLAGLGETDAVAYVGNSIYLNPFLTEGGVSASFAGDNWDPLDYSAEPGNIIAVSTLAADSYVHKLNANSIEESIAFGILHGSGHSAGIGHTDHNPDYNADKVNTNSYTMEGPIVVGKIKNEGMSIIDFFEPEEQPLTIEAHKARFGDNTPKDNYNENKVKNNRALGIGTGEKLLKPKEGTGELLLKSNDK